MGKPIQITNLCFAYQDEKILKHLNLIIGRKTFLSIIGPNGSGKTTLLKNIARNLKPSQGSILIDGLDINQYSAAALARDMAVVHQNPDISVEFTVFDVVMMGRHPYIPRFKRETPQDRAMVDQALHQTNTFHLQDRYINEISGGERQRVMIAKALAQEPQVLLLDEPTSFLDIHHQIEILELLRKLKRDKQISVISVIHDLNLAARYSDEIMLLHEGNILTLGPTEKVMTADQLQKAYDMDMIVDRNVYTGRLEICPLSVRQRQSGPAIRVHVIGGGGMGKEVLLRCFRESYSVSLGVVNRGDSDAEMAGKLLMEVVEEEPFCDISDRALEKAVQKAEIADAVILTSIPIGHGNLKNLHIAQKQLREGKVVLFLNTYDKGIPFDYVDGEGERIMRELIEMGMRECREIDELVATLKSEKRKSEAHEILEDNHQTSDSGCNK